MNTINHALWGATIGRVVGLPIEGSIIATVPDIASIPLFAYSKYKLHLEVKKSPEWIFKIYYVFHNWFVGIVVMGALFLISPKFGVLGFGYMWHIVEDAFLHTDMATPFLWPFWKGKFNKYSAAKHVWVQVVDLVLIILTNLWISKVL